MIGRADIEGSKSNVAMNAWLPQASYPCGNFSDTSNFRSWNVKGSIGLAFTVCIITENQNQDSFYPFIQHEISVLIELSLGHLCYLLTDVPPQPNSPPDVFFDDGPMSRGQWRNHFWCNQKHASRLIQETRYYYPSQCYRMSETTSRVVVFHCWFPSHLYYTSSVISQRRTRVKLNRVFFPRRCCQARSLGCGFARWWIGTVGISLIHSCASLIRWRGIWLP